MKVSATESFELGVGMAQTLSQRLRDLERRLSQLLKSSAIPFDDQLHGALPQEHGIYRIFDPAKPEETIRAGRTNIAAGGLRQRVYQNHLMGDQEGNLRAQLVRGGLFGDLAEAKIFLRATLRVQVLVVEDAQERASLEHYMLAVLEPRYCD